jgi:hypothetical protein
MIRSTIKNVAVIVAPSYVEALWAGGTMLSPPSWNCFVVCLKPKNDTDRASKFHKALQVFKSRGIMGDLDDGPALNPLADKEVQRIILELLPNQHFDLFISHSPSCEYTRHIWHQEVGRAVIKLRHSGKISTTELWSFAYTESKPE